ncbi:MAG: hydroxymethylbilane synthase [Sedimentisphaerales bacterium]|nr:hydroxymethylbilane synthase [Sedimentisphaerales bacterium]
MRTIRIATRASKLALAQSHYVAFCLKSISNDINISIVGVSTKGDRDRSDFLYKTGTVGFFTSEVENALLDSKADLAVHSFKDLPTAIRPGLIIAAVPQRENPADALVCSKEAVSIEALPKAATVGTSSLRRIAQVKNIRPDLDCVPLRGNVETRIAKVGSGHIGAIIIAAAGLNRLGLSEKITAVLPPKIFVPAPAQGALAVQIREDDIELEEIVKKLDVKEARITAETERCVLAAMHGGCSIPLGVHARIEDDNIFVDAVISDLDGKNLIRRSAVAPVEKSVDCAERLANELLDAGGKKILDEIRIDRALNNRADGLDPGI